MRHKVLAVGAVLVLAAVGLGTAHAASLSLTSANLTAFSSTRCTVSVSPAPDDPVLFGILGYQAVRLSVPAPCSGAEVLVTVHRDNGTVRTTGTATVPGPGVVMVPTGRYGGLFDQDYDFAVTIDGWYVPNA